MTLHVANEMDEVEVAVWWDLSRIVRHFERQGLERRAVKAAVMNAASVSYTHLTLPTILLV